VVATFIQERVPARCFGVPLVPRLCRDSYVRVPVGRVEYAELLKFRQWPFVSWLSLEV
jgi:hypothetical protein